MSNLQYATVISVIGIMGGLILTVVLISLMLLYVLRPIWKEKITSGEIAP